MTTSENADRSYCRSYQQASKSVGRARCDVVAFARTCGFADRQLADIEAAVGEGLANAFEHGHCENGGFEVWVRRDRTTLVVEIKDSGRGFDHAAHAVRQPSAEALRGFGIFIMRELMDDIQYTEYGTRLRLLKRLPNTVD